MDIKDLTIAGWMLLLATVAAALGLGIPLLVVLSNALPKGPYPRILFAAPVFIIGFVVFFVGSKILRQLGKPISKRS